MKNNSVIIYNPKGGEGKSTIASNLYYLNRWEVVTNDMNYAYLEYVRNEDVEIIFNIDTILKKFERSQEPIICDLGGFYTTDIKTLLDKCGLLLIPIRNDLFSLKTFSLMKDLLANIKIPNVAVIANYVTCENDIKCITETVRKIKKLENAQIFPLQKSNVFIKCYKNKKSVVDITKDSAFLSYIYRKPIKQLLEINNFVKEKVCQ